MTAGHFFYGLGRFVQRVRPAEGKDELKSPFADPGHVEGALFIIIEVGSLADQ